ncbi:hypothetical protein [Methylovirgula sp. 4M-Z18]|uniref:hypothetical protein n=1 Tax=Methylovirgula sp. 4M-Z18 TaxID=2293567 RepID=UPI0011C05CFF|nr:hypothetical protein [Methylovirgula sp. 4M-Z18]
MTNSKLIFPFCTIFVTSFVSGCGITAPQMSDISSENRTDSPNNLEVKIKSKIFCELQKAVSDINNPSIRTPYEEYYNGTMKYIKPLPDKWGVQLTIQLAAEENTSINPGATFIDPLSPAKSFGSAVSRSYSTAVGASISADATNTHKYTFYYLVSDLEGDQPECKKYMAPDFTGGSLLIDGDLGIYGWLNNAMNVRSSIGTSRSVQQEAVSYDIKFDVVTSGGFTPTWKLLRVTTGNGSLNLINAKRERTHELILTFGPSQTDKNGKAQPSTIASNEDLAQKIGAAVANALKSGSP